MSGPEWSEILPAPPAGGTLSEAWFTTFEQPEASLLVEHLLPSLLGLGHSLSHELEERTLFFGELGTALERLHGRITVVSSPAQAAGQAPQYPWLWRYVSRFTVGVESSATQHAKLWAFHWRIGDSEQLDLCVSSTNLTASAFKKQLQAGWKGSLDLGDRVTKKAWQSWGELIPFLEALGTSAGAHAKERIDRLIQLLARAECPEGITFVASIPGSNKRGTQALKRLAPSAIHILTPTVGDWTKDTLTAWSKDVGVAADKIHLKWLDAHHPWAHQNGWALTEEAKTVLLGKRVQLNQLPSAARFSDEHADGDERWSHAKLYLLKIPGRQKRQLLVTSANWSPSAWGAGKDEPARNFELGVLLETDWKMLEDLKDTLSTPFCVERDRTGDGNLQWAEASWDGEQIKLCARSSDDSTAVSATVSFGNGTKKHLSLVGGLAALSWKKPDVPPLTALFSQGAETLEVSVIDLRPPKEFSKTPLPEVDPSVAAALRDAFLLQRYGGLVVDIESIFGRSGARLPVGGAPPAADYSVQAWLDARAAFGVVDSWQSALDKAKSDPMLLERVRLDGRDLFALYRRREGPAPDLAAEELGWRLGENA